MKASISWWAGEPTAAGDQPDAKAAYVVWSAKDEATGNYFNVHAVHIKNRSELGFLRTVKMPEPTSGLGSEGEPLAVGNWGAGIAFVNGPFKNV